MINGAPTDPNAAEFKAGAHSVLDSSGFKVAAEFDTPDWSPDKAQEWMEGQLSSDHRPTSSASTPPTTARPVAPSPPSRVAASTPLPPVTGQDAELAAIQRIVAGDQAMTIYKAIKTEAETAAEGRGRARQRREARRRPTDKRGRPVDHLRPGRRHEGQHQGHRGRGRLLQGRPTSAPRSTPTRAPRPASAEPRLRVAAPGDTPVAAAATIRPKKPRRLIDDCSPHRPVLSLTRGISKRFGAVQALKDIELRRPRRRGGRPGRRQRRRQVHPGQDDRRGLPARRGARSSSTARRSRVSSPAEAQELGIATVFQDLALCDNLDVVANLFLGQRAAHGPGRSTRSRWRRSPGGCCAQLSAKIPSVRIPVASLSGGQRQTVAIARSLLGEPKVVMLDEPTAALGVAQTAEVLNLVERLRESGLGVILISHNMADVQAVADRVVVLRLGRNNGVFRVSETTDAGHHRRHHRRDRQRRLRARRAPDPQEEPHHDAPRPGADAAGHRRPGHRERDPATPPSCRPTSQDERLIASQGLGGCGLGLHAPGCAAATSARCRSSSGWSSSGGSSTLANRAFLSSRNLVNLTLQIAAVGIIALGIVLVLLLGEIDLSVGSVSGLSAAILAVLFVNKGWPLVAVLAGRRRAGAGDRAALRHALHPVRRAELRHHPGRPARLARPAAAACSATRARSTCPSTRALVGFATRSSSPPRLAYALVAVVVAAVRR